MSFPRYPKYKDSGVEWLGEVPDHWVVDPLKRSVAVLTEKTNRRENPVGLENIDSWTGQLIPTEAEFQGDGIAFERGDILFGKLRPYLAKVLLAEAQGEAIGDLLVLHPTGSLSGRFVQFLMLTREFISLVDGSTFGSKMPRASWDYVGSVPVPIPPRCEQKSIERFLVHAIAKVDTLLIEQQRLISLLLEKQRAVVSHTVTKGVDPDARLKASGLDWVDSIPEHWHASRLGWYASVENGTTPDRTDQTYWNEGTVPWLSSGEVNQGDIDNAGEAITEKALAECSLRLLPRGTIVVGMIGEGRTRGLAAITRISAVVNQNLAAILPSDRLDSQYLLYVVRAMYEYIREQGRGGNQAALNCQIISALRIPVPPIEEQRTISAWLAQRDAESRRLIEEAERAITLLSEYRSALISAAVTGKIDVRNYTADQAEAA